MVHPSRVPGLLARIGSALLGVTLVVPGIVLLAAPAGAATLTVPGAFGTIQAALDAAQSGDTVTVGPGEYLENLDFHAKNVRLQSGAGAAATTIRVLTGTAVLIGPGGALVGFTVTGANDFFGAGMAVSGGGTLVQGNIFDGNTESGGGFGAAIGGNGASPTIDRNLFRNNTCDNQFLSGVVAFVNQSSPRITNNVFAHNPCRAITMTLPEGSAPRVINNTVVDNRTGVRVDTRVPTSGQTFRNNVITGNGTGLEVEFGTPANIPTWDHNDVSGNAVDYAGLPDQTGVNANRSVDPGFVNAAVDDYHLAPGSPAIDVGAAATAPATDFDGDTRPVDGNADGVAGFDLGAFEFGRLARPVALRIAPGQISLAATATVRVTVLSTAGFLAPRQLVRASLRFGRTGAEPSLQGCDAPKDLNADGRLDLSCRFRVKATALQPGDLLAVLTGQTFPGRPVSGGVAVQVTV
jgi:serine protease